MINLIRIQIAVCSRIREGWRDSAGRPDRRASFRGGRRSAGPIMVSGETGEGVDALWGAIFDAVRALPAGASELAEGARRA